MELETRTELNALDRAGSGDAKPRYPGIRLMTNGNQLVAYYTEARIADAGIFYPITPSTEMGESFQLSFAKGELNVFGQSKIAIELEGEHAAQGGAIAYAVTGKRVVNFTSGQGIVYGLEQYYHAPGKLTTMVLEVSARALTKHALNVHCGHDDVYAALDTGWMILFAMDAQQAADQAVILRRVCELALTPGMNCQDGFLTSHLERTFRKCEAGLLREFLGRPDDIIDCPTLAQAELFGPTRRRVPECIDLENPALLGSVQNQEHYMGGIAARRHHFSEHCLGFLEDSFAEFGRLTGRYYGLVSEYNNQGAETAFVCIGSAAENCHAAVDYIKEKQGAQVGVVHLNVLRPFPEAAVIKALAGKKRIIIIERSDEQLAGDGPIAREVRTALSKALDNNTSDAHSGIPAITVEQVPRIFSGVYGLGSRDFRPEGILGAYEFAIGRGARQDGKTADEGTSFFYIGINHPYNVESEDKPSLLPTGAISIRFHSIGGWGMITTGKNLSEMFGELGNYISRRDQPDDPDFAAVRVSANPKYGSEKKGAPTNYFLVVAPDPIRVNCDLHHVNVVLCCDPKVFTHTNPLVGLEDGGSFVWESSETDDAKVWERIPRRHRQEIIEKGIRIFVLDGFKIARESTDRADLEYRMQGNSFLGAFFRVSSFLQDNDIPEDEFLRIVMAQYEKKFGRFGEAVVASNMKVMKSGFQMVREVPAGTVDAPDTSSMRGEKSVPITLGNQEVGRGPINGTANLVGVESGGNAPGTGANGSPDRDGGQAGASARTTRGRGNGTVRVEHGLRPPLMSRESYDSQFRGDWGYNQPSTPHAATGAIAAATGEATSKYVARRQVPMWIPENCTQCMDCITSCPDTALPNTAQEISRVLDTALHGYVKDSGVRERIKMHLPAGEEAARAVMTQLASPKAENVPQFHEIVVAELDKLFAADAWFAENGETAAVGVGQFKSILEKVPFAYSKTSAIFKVVEKKSPGEGGIFGIFVDDRCKGCGECVEECGDHNALVMVDETEQIEGFHQTGIAFLDELPNTPDKYLGKFDPKNPMESKAAALQQHLMVRDNYEALRSGDGACAGCGEKSILRAIASLTEAYLRPVYHAKAERLERLADDLDAVGLERITELEARDPESCELVRKSVLHVIMGLGGEDDNDTNARIAAEFNGTDGDLLDALKAVLRHDAVMHRDIQAVDGGLSNGMSVMAMAASTGCNTVYGSTHPNNPHPYPWMNSLFQDGATIGWLMAESFITNHVRRSVIPERLARVILEGKGASSDDYFSYTHFSDAGMTDQEVNELPRVWAVGGDGAFGDIGFQNVSKVVLQNRPNLQLILLDTQVYSNTGGQNSDSSPMPGGFDMNQFGPASEGKMTEMKSVAQALTSGHGSPFVAQVSMANTSALYSALLEAIAYRGTGFIQSFTTCQPEHGVADDVATQQARFARDSRGIPEFVYNPALGESYHEALRLKGNPDVDKDWWFKTTKAAGRFKFTIANWARTEARFRRHFHKVDPAGLDDLIELTTILWKITQQDVIHRRYLDPEHRCYIPERGVYAMVENDRDGTLQPIGLSRHMVLFCVERRKSWRMLQSKAGINSLDRAAQQRIIKEFDEGLIPVDVFHSRIEDLIETARIAEKKGDKKSRIMSLMEAGQNNADAS